MSDDKVESRSERSRLRERTRGALRGAGSATHRYLRRTRERASHALDATGERLKQTAAAKRMGAALETRRVLRKSEAAHSRGNPAMAYRLLQSELRAKPDDDRLAIAFWHTCGVLERGSEASGPLLEVIRRRASAGDLDTAAELWCELVDVECGARADAGTLVRIASVLRESAPDRAVQALRATLEPDTPGLTPGLATRVVEQARELDPHTALLAAQWVLDSADLADAKRDRLERCVAELEREMAGAARRSEPTPSDAGAAESGTIDVSQNAAPTLDDEVAELVVEQTVEAFTPSTRFCGVKATEVESQSLASDAVLLQMQGGRRARLDYAKVQALGVAEVAGPADAPVVLIDLVLNWGAGDGEQLRVVRLRADRFADSDPTPSQSLRSMLAELLSRTDAVPLPDREAAVGAPFRYYDDVGSYEREVLLAG